MRKWLLALAGAVLAAWALERLNLDWRALLHGQWKPALLSLRQAVARAGEWKYFVYLFLFAALPLAFVPVSLLCVAAAVLFPPLQAGLLIWGGSLASAALSFWLARGLGRGLVERFFLSRLETLRRLDAGAGRNGFVVCLISRFLPVPYVFPGYAAGLSTVSFRDLAGGSALAMLPWSVFYALFGRVIAQGSPREVGLIALLFAAIFTGALWARKAALRRAGPGAP